MIANHPFGGNGFRPGLAGPRLGQVGAADFFGFVGDLTDAYGDIKEAEANEALADAQKDAARAIVEVERIRLERERLEREAEKGERAGDIIPGVPNWATVGGGAAAAVGIAWAIFGG